MSISTALILVDGTVATTGGTSTGLISKGDTLEVSRNILDDAAEFLAETRVDFSIKDPKVSAGAPNGYTQARSTAKISSPLVLDNGNNTVNTLEQKLSVDPETTDAEIQTMLVNGAQLLIAAAFSDFWNKRTLSLRPKLSSLLLY